MVVDVSKNSNSSLEKILYEFRYSVSESIHECEMSILQYKYTFLQENGIILEESNDQSVFSKIKNAIKTFINKAIQYVKELFRKFKEWLKKVKNKFKNKNKAEDAAKEVESEAKDKCDNIINLFDAECKSCMEDMNNAEQCMKNVKKFTNEIENDFVSLGVKFKNSAGEIIEPKDFESFEKEMYNKDSELLFSGNKEELINLKNKIEYANNEGLKSKEYLSSADKKLSKLKRYNF